MSRDNAVQELTDLVESQSLEPEKHTIGQLIPEAILHDYTSLDVLTAAAEKNCIIIKCCNDDDMYKANGEWFKPPKELADRLRKYPNLSSSYCPGCAEQVRRDITHFQSLRQERVEVPLRQVRAEAASY